MNIKKGDKVKVMTGSSKGHTGVVLRVLIREDKVIVSGANMKTCHIKKTKEKAGEIVKKEAGIHVSNVAIIDPKTKKPTRISYDIKDGNKKRVSSRSKVEI